MHQTERYQLNLIESSDPFLPDGLNQNTRKVEEVLAAREALNDQILAQMDGRVSALEAHRYFVGSFRGTGSSIFVNLNATPMAVFAICGGVFHAAIAGYDNSLCLQIVEGGFVTRRQSTTSAIDNGLVYAFVAFV